MELKHLILPSLCLIFLVIGFVNGDSLLEENFGNFANMEAIDKVSKGQFKVANAAWWGFDEQDSTNALQSAINSGARKIIVPFMGKDWVVRPIYLMSDQEIVFEPIN